jgi:hypothetical protein
MRRHEPSSPCDARRQQSVPISGRPPPVGPRALLPGDAAWQYNGGGGHKAQAHQREAGRGGDLSEPEPSTSDLRALGGLVREMQRELRAASTISRPSR